LHLALLLLNLIWMFHQLETSRFKLVEQDSRFRFRFKLVEQDSRFRFRFKLVEQESATLTKVTLKPSSLNKSYFIKLNISVIGLG